MRASRTLQRPAELIDAGLVPAERRAAIAAVAERYAVAITPVVADLIDGDNPDDPIGRRILLTTDPPTPGAAWTTIVGVAPNIRQRDVREPRPDPVVYLPYRADLFAYYMPFGAAPYW